MSKGRRGMETTGDNESSETAAVGIVIGIIDILAMIIVIAILCTMDFQF
jgi:hypothetical protein